MLGPARKFSLSSHVNIRMFGTAVNGTIRALFCSRFGHRFVPLCQCTISTSLLYWPHLTRLHSSLDPLLPNRNLTAHLRHLIELPRTRNVVVFFHPFQHQSNKIAQPPKESPDVIRACETAHPLRHKAPAQHERIHARCCQELIDHAGLPRSCFPHLVEPHHPLP